MGKNKRRCLQNAKVNFKYFKDLHIKKETEEKCKENLDN